MPLHSGRETRLDIFSSVIDVEDLLWSSAGLDDGSPVDDRVGLAGAHGTGIDPSGEVAGETKVCFQVGYVDGIRIREQHKAVAASELLEQVFAEDGLQIEGAVPRCAELLKCVCGLQAASEMHVPFTRLDPPFLPLTPRGSVSIAVQTCSGERLAPPPSVVRARFRLTLTITRPMSKMIALTALPDSGACGLVRESSATASLGRLPRLVGAGKERWSLSEASGTSRAARRRWPVVARGRRPQRSPSGCAG